MFQHAETLSTSAEKETVSLKKTRAMDHQAVNGKRMNKPLCVVSKNVRLKMFCCSLLNTNNKKKINFQNQKMNKDIVILHFEVG